PDLLRSIFLEGAIATRAPGAFVAARERELACELERQRATPRVVLATDGLSKRFAGVTAVDDVSLQLHEGEILGMIGPNGAGKTTVFDLVSGFLVPDAGRVVLQGRDVAGLRPQE